MQTTEEILSDILHIFPNFANSQFWCSAIRFGVTPLRFGDQSSSTFAKSRTAAQVCNAYRYSVVMPRTENGVHGRARFV